jgi:hypothetical protein
MDDTEVYCDTCADWSCRGHELCEHCQDEICANCQGCSCLATPCDDWPLCGQ